MFDLVFTFQQFVNDLPDSYEQFSEQLSAYFPQIYDTKSMALASGCFGRTNLQSVYERVTQDKKFKNNLVVELELRENESHYSQKGIEAHDAGWDAYMTGVIFAQIGKYIEIGNIFKSRAPQAFDKYKQKSRKAPLEAFEGFATNSSAVADKKHFTAVQNQQMSMDDLEFFRNRVVMNIEIPRFFHLGKVKETPQERSYMKNMEDSTLWVKTNEDMTVEEVAKLFSVYGDVEIVKDTYKAYFVEFTYLNEEAKKKKK